MVIAKTITEPHWFPRSVLLHPLCLLLALHIGWIVITCFYSSEPWLSVKYLLAKIWYIVPLVILPQQLLSDRSAFRKLAICLLLPMAFVVIQTILRHAALGFSFEKIRYVFSPFFRNHVNYSSMLVCLLALTWCAKNLSAPGGRLRKWLFAALVAGLIALFFAYSRGAWLALLAGITGGWLIRKKWLLHAIAVVLLLVCFSVAYLVREKQFMDFRPAHDQTIFHTDFREHMRATWKGKDVSNAERLYRWVAGARMVAEEPVTGFGPNAFYLHYRPYTVRSFETWVSDNPEHSTVHNYFLLVALEQGWPGLVLFSVLLIAMLWYTQRLYHRFPDPYYRTIALTVGCVLIMISVINCMSDMIETDKIGGLFWLCLGIIVRLGRTAPCNKGAEHSAIS